METEAGDALNVHQKIREMMRQRGWSEYRLAAEAGLSQSTIANLFRRGTLPSLPTLECICRAFGLTLAQFFAEDAFFPLSSEEQELLRGWSRLDDGQKQLLLALVRQLNEKPAAK